VGVWGEGVKSFSKEVSLILRSWNQTGGGGGGVGGNMMGWAVRERGRWDKIVERGRPIMESSPSGGGKGGGGPELEYGNNNKTS